MIMSQLPVLLMLRCDNYREMAIDGMIKGYRVIYAS